MSVSTRRTAELVGIARRCMARHYDPPNIVMQWGRECVVGDVDGRLFLDGNACYSALNVGHAHPKVMEAVRRQLDRGLTAIAASFWEEQRILLARELTELCNMDRVVFGNGGVDGFEIAVKLARAWAYRRGGVLKPQAKIVVCQGNFHGRTLTAISASDVHLYKDPFVPLLGGFIQVPFNDVKKLADVVRGDSEIVAVIIEPIQAEGGINIPDKGYLQKVREICDRCGTLLILDEIQTGFGRTGKLFASEYDNVEPDAYILGKALGGGLVISAVVGKDRLMNVFEPGEHGSTFAGNPLSCAAARAAIDVIIAEGLVQRSAELGEYFLGCLKQIAVPQVREVRGKGLLIGIEFVEKLAHRACEKLLTIGERRRFAHKSFVFDGLLCKEAREHVLRLSPPLVVERDVIDLMVEMIGEVFKELSSVPN